MVNGSLMTGGLGRAAGSHCDGDHTSGGDRELIAPPDKSPVFYDEYHGQGGQYHLIDGKRVRVEPEKS